MKLIILSCVWLPFSILALPTTESSDPEDMHEIERRQTTRVDLTSKGCKDIIVVFARGTLETGNVGTLTGPPFFNAITSKVGNSATVAVQGVEYPAVPAGFFAGGDKQGSQTMADLVTKAISQCPQSKVVMSGYSQGGQLVHNAAKLLPAATMAAVSSVVIFGDPNNGTAVTGTSAAKTLVVCHSGDAICDQQDAVLPPHLTYSRDANRAAAFVVSNAGL